MREYTENKPEMTEPKTQTKPQSGEQTRSRDEADSEDPPQICRGVD